MDNYNVDMVNERAKVNEVNAYGDVGFLLYPNALAAERMAAVYVSIVNHELWRVCVRIVKYTLAIVHRHRRQFCKCKYTGGHGQTTFRMIKCILFVPLANAMAGK